MCASSCEKASVGTSRANCEALGQQWLIKGYYINAALVLATLHRCHITGSGIKELAHNEACPEQGARLFERALCGALLQQAELLGTTAREIFMGRAWSWGKQIQQIQQPKEATMLSERTKAI
jgi:hypothetical protein